MPSSPRFATALVALAALLAAGTAGAQYRGVVGGDPGAASRAIAEAERAERSVESLLADPDYDRLLQSASDLKKKLQQGQAQLALAREAYATGTAVKYSEAAQFAISAKRTLGAVETELRGRWERARAAEAIPGRPDEQETALRASLRSELDSLAREARDLLARPAPTTDAMLERRGAVGKALRDLERVGAATPSGELTRLREALWTSSAELRTALRSPAYHGPEAQGSYAKPGIGSSRRQPPDVLRSAVAAFFAGDYREAASLLATAELGDDHATKVAHLIRGAALFSMYVESGERDQALLDRAVADVRECQRLDPTLEPDRAAFSPRYAELFRR